MNGLPCDAEKRPSADVPELEPDLRQAGLLHVGEGDEVAVAEVEVVPRGGAGEGTEEDDEDVRLVDAAQGDGAVAFRRQSAALTDVFSMIMNIEKSQVTSASICDINKTKL